MNAASCRLSLFRCIRSTISKHWQLDSRVSCNLWEMSVYMSNTKIMPCRSLQVSRGSVPPSPAMVLEILPKKLTSEAEQKVLNAIGGLTHTHARGRVDFSTQVNKDFLNFLSRFIKLILSFRFLKTTLVSAPYLISYTHGFCETLTANVAIGWIFFKILRGKIAYSR